MASKLRPFVVLPLNSALYTCPRMTGSWRDERSARTFHIQGIHHRAEEPIKIRGWIRSPGTLCPRDELEVHQVDFQLPNEEIRQAFMMFFTVKPISGSNRHSGIVREGSALDLLILYRIFTFLLTFLHSRWVI